MSIQLSPEARAEFDGVRPLLDSDCESRTRWDERDSSAKSRDSETGGESDADEWGRQQKRVFHRVHTLLSYWEQHEYQIRWITLTSSPESDDADRLAYNHRRLRQTVERAKMAKDADGDGHRLSHVREIESLVIRTCEGPDGKGVLHLFWAWNPPEGQHSREFFVPHDWLSKQWGRIHGPYERRNPGDVQAYTDEIKGLHVWVEAVGDADYHSTENLASYCVSQYLGEHGEALENVSWSWERTLGGSVTEAWDAVKNMVESVEAAVEVWHELLGGEEVRYSPDGPNVSYEQVVKPPPDLEVRVGNVSVTPPEEYRVQGPDVEVVRTVEKIPEYDPAEWERGLCPECREYFVMERAQRLDERVSYVCTSESCGAEFAAPGEGTRVVEQEFETWDVEPSPPDRGEWESQDSGESGDGCSDGSALLEFSREGRVFDPDSGDESGTGSVDGESDGQLGRGDLERVEELVRTGEVSGVVEAMGRLGLPPSARSRVEEVVG